LLVVFWGLKLPPFIFWHGKPPSFRSPQRSRWGLVLVCFSLFSASLIAQSTSDGDSQQLSISGLVINALTGAPIQRSLVKLNQQAVLTDHDGRFEFKNAASSSGQSGTLNLTAEKPGFFGNNGKLAFLNAPEVGSTGDPNTTITLRLYPEAIISGTVQGADGGPLTNGSIELRKYAIVDGRRQWQNAAQTRPNAEGEFRFANLQPGDYSVVALIREQPSLAKNGQTGYLPERYPSSSSADDISPLHLSAGQEASIELTPRLEHLYAVTGYVSGSREARGSFQVRSNNNEFRSVSANYNPQTGAFHLLLPSGFHEISATFFEGGGQNRTQLFGTTQVNVGEGNVEGVTLSLQQTTTIPILVEMQSAASTTGQTPATNNLNIQLVPLPPSSAMQGAWSRQEGPGGLFLPNVIPGRYAVVAHAGGGWYIKSITWGATDVSRDPLVIGPSAGYDPIRVVLQNDTGQVKIRVNGNGQTTRGYLYLVPAEPSEISMQTISFSMNSSGFNNAVSFGSVPPGDYVLLAYDQPHELAYRDPDILRQLSSIGKSVTVPGNGEVDVDVDLLQADAGNQ
jgi:hypothetical protein